MEKMKWVKKKKQFNYLLYVCKRIIIKKEKMNKSAFNFILKEIENKLFQAMIHPEKW